MHQALWSFKTKQCSVHTPPALRSNDFLYTAPSHSPISSHLTWSDCETWKRNEKACGSSPVRVISLFFCLWRGTCCGYEKSFSFVVISFWFQQARNGEVRLPDWLPRRICWKGFARCCVVFSWLAKGVLWIFPAFLLAEGCCCSCCEDIW